MESYSSGVAVTPHDTTNYTDGTADALWVGGVGNVVIVPVKGAAITLTAVAAGTLLKIRHVRVNATNTTATLMVALRSDS